MQRRQLEVENGIITAEEAQQQEMDEQTVREKFNIKLDTGVENMEEDSVKEQSMQELLQKINDGAKQDEIDSDEEYNNEVFGKKENENGK